MIHRRASIRFVRASGSIGHMPYPEPIFVAELAMNMAGVHLKAMDMMYWRESKPSLEENMAALEINMAATAEAMAALPPIPETGPINPHVATLHMVYSCHKRQVKGVEGVPPIFWANLGLT